MTAEPVAQSQRTLQVDAVAVAKVAEVGALERLRPGPNEEFIGRILGDGETGAVDGHALAEGQVGSERSSEREMLASSGSSGAWRVMVPSVSTRPVNMKLASSVGRVCRRSDDLIDALVVEPIGDAAGGHKHRHAIANDESIRMVDLKALAAMQLYGKHAIRLQRTQAG